MKLITIADLDNWGACGRDDQYSDSRLKMLLRGRKGLTVLQVLNLRSVPAEDKLWVVLREELIEARTLHLFACWCAEQALLAERKARREPDQRSWAAIRAKRDWVDGKINDGELSSAWSSAWSSAKYATLSTERYATLSAAWSTERSSALSSTWSATWSATWSTTWSEQIKQLKKMLKGCE